MDNERGRIVETLMKSGLLMVPLTDKFIPMEDGYTQDRILDALQSDKSKWLAAENCGIWCGRRSQFVAFDLDQHGEPVYEDGKSAKADVRQRHQNFINKLKEHPKFSELYLGTTKGSNGDIARVGFRLSHDADYPTKPLRLAFLGSKIDNKGNKGPNCILELLSRRLCFCPPSKGYTDVQNTLDKAPYLTHTEFEMLMKIVLDVYGPIPEREKLLKEPKVFPQIERSLKTDQMSSVEHFKEVGAFRHSLSSSGWDFIETKVVVHSDGVQVLNEYYRHPNATHVWSASYAPELDCFCVFSDNTDFEQKDDAKYSGFQAHCILMYGDACKGPDGKPTKEIMQREAKRLWAFGYGSKDFKEEKEAVAIDFDMSTKKPDTKAKVVFEFQKLADDIKMVMLSELDGGCTGEDIWEGVFAENERMFIAGPPKSGKSWIAMDLAQAIANGEPFWGRKTKKSKVLFVNFELKPKSFKNRCDWIAEHWKRTIDQKNFLVWNLRSAFCDWKTIGQSLYRVAKDQGVQVIILDPQYRLLGGLDENSAGDMSQLVGLYQALNEICSIIVVQHYPKGQAGIKASTDRIAGSNVLVRDPDCVVTLLEHSEKDKLVAEFDCRDHIKIEKIGLETKFLGGKGIIVKRDDTVNTALIKVKENQKTSFVSASDLSKLFVGVTEFLTVSEMDSLIQDRFNTAVSRTRAIRERMLEKWLAYFEQQKEKTDGKLGKPTKRWRLKEMPTNLDLINFDKIQKNNSNSSCNDGFSV